MHPDWKWVIPFTIVDSCNRVFYGITSTLMGPSQPFLAKAVNVDIDTINWMTPFGSLAALIGAIFSSMIFKKYFTSCKQKMIYLSVCTVICGVSSVLPLYTKSFQLLILVMSLRMFAGQMLEVPCQGLYVYMLGAKRSQPFIMMFHSTVAIGFFLGPVLLRPFFPEQSLSERSQLCDSNGNLTKMGTAGNESNMSLKSVIETIKWPYWIVLYGHFFCAVGYCAILCLPFRMPVDFEQKLDQKQTGSKTDAAALPADKWILLTIVILYMAGCGTERLFQGLQFTFGLCGPLQLPASEAVLSDEFYNGGFFAGRLVSILAVNFMSPKVMLKCCISLCAVSSLFLSMEAGNSATLLYSCVGLYGFAISWQFGSAYSWSAEYLDVVGPRAAIFNLGCSLSFIAPLTGGYLFNRWTPMAMWHLNLVFVVVQIMAFFGLSWQFNGVQKIAPRQNQYSYRELNQLDEINLSTSDED